MGSGRLREFTFTDRDEARAGYKTPKPATNLPLPIQNVTKRTCICSTNFCFLF